MYVPRAFRAPRVGIFPHVQLPRSTAPINKERHRRLRLSTLTVHFSASRPSRLQHGDGAIPLYWRLGPGPRDPRRGATSWGVGERRRRRADRRLLTSDGRRISTAAASALDQVLTGGPLRDPYLPVGQHSAASPIDATCSESGRNIPPSRRLDQLSARRLVGTRKADPVSGDERRGAARRGPPFLSLRDSAVGSFSYRA